MDWLNLVDAGATLSGALIVTYQIIQLKRQEVRDYLADYNSRYETIVARIPLDLMLGGNFDEVHFGSADARAFFDYFQLCEEQLGLNPSAWRRVTDESRATNDVISTHALRFTTRDLWHQALTEWKCGMKTNASRPAFRSHFDALRSRDRTLFTKLAGLIEPGPGTIGDASQQG